MMVAISGARYDTPVPVTEMVRGAALETAAGLSAGEHAPSTTAVNKVRAITDNLVLILVSFEQFRIAIDRTKTVQKSSGKANKQG
jgi:hypothetical protein